MPGVTLRAQKGSIADKVHHSTRWKGLARVITAEQPVCCDPYHLHCDTYEQTRTVHHIVAIEKDPALAWEKSNLVGLCFKCHAHIEFLEQRGLNTVPHVRKCRGVIRQLTPRPDGNVCFRLTVDAVFCHRMNLHRATPCGPCQFLHETQTTAATGLNCPP